MSTELNPYEPPRAHAAPGADLDSTPRCRLCARRPARKVLLQQNIGAVIVRFPKILSGHLCRPCFDHHCRKMTLTTLGLGWWGVISFFHTLVILPMNLLAWVRMRSLPKPQD